MSDMTDTTNLREPMTPQYMAEVVQAAIETLCANGFQSRTHRLCEVRDRLHQGLQGMNTTADKLAEALRALFTSPREGEAGESVRLACGESKLDAARFALAAYDAERATAAERRLAAVAPAGMMLVPRDEIERAVKVMRYAAHPHPSPNADALAKFLDATPPAARAEPQAGEWVLERPARVAGRDFATGEPVQRVLGRAYAHYDAQHAPSPASRARPEAQGEAFGYVMEYPHAMPTTAYIHAPEFVKRLARAEQLRDGCEREYGEPAKITPVYTAPPADRAPEAQGEADQYECRVILRDGFGKWHKCSREQYDHIRLTGFYNGPGGAQCEARALYATPPADRAPGEVGEDDAKLVDALADHAYSDAADGRSCPSDATEQARAALIRRLAALVPEGVTEYGWLIENGKHAPDLRYRTMEQGIPAWTDDHMKALRFCRREDAERFAAEDDEAWSIVEHAWHRLPDLTTTKETTDVR